ncbi:DUF3082 domain-containing protein [Cyanobacterium sp. Dongsha4]|uniref:DUF3082 domain-containing protein n=1 Tax=Cyanobacterium sp. DS4 TaxID=2878255 RepID=UPI002E819215|nr:DUF3082 domain-containing protein [Cyanobacterium sp. Dongsha4]WVK99188.1 DUF3082 domain-containing protein [Cyanobacterium sp. Dongsha4]
MTDNEKKEPIIPSPEVEQEKITPLRCMTGSAISGGLAVAAYLLTKSVILTYVNMPIKFNNPLAANIASTVRTLIMGVTTMATFLFLMVAVGLFALGVKRFIEEKREPIN